MKPFITEIMYNVTMRISGEKTGAFLFGLKKTANCFRYIFIVIGIDHKSRIAGIRAANCFCLTNRRKNYLNSNLIPDS